MFAGGFVGFRGKPVKAASIEDHKGEVFNNILAGYVEDTLCDE